MKTKNKNFSQKASGSKFCRAISTVELIIYSTISTLLFGAAFMMVNNLYRYYIDLNKIAQVDNYAQTILNRLSGKFKNLPLDEIGIYETFFVQDGKIFYQENNVVVNFYDPSIGISVENFSLDNFSNPNSNLITVQLEIGYNLRSGQGNTRTFESAILIRNHD